jgi:anti-anti-sigma factor
MQQPPAFSVSPERPVPEVLVLVVRGDVDLATAPGVEAHAEVALEADGPGTVIVDLRGCDFIDSSGLGMLLRLRSALEERGAKLVVAADGGAVHRSMSITGVDSQLHVVADPAAAIAAARAPDDR